jgi:hypothetical protein
MIGIFDLEVRESFGRLIQFFDTLVIPRVTFVCGNAHNATKKPVFRNEEKAKISANSPYFDISTKTKLNCDRVILCLIRDLLSDQSVEFFNPKMSLKYILS